MEYKNKKLHPKWQDLINTLLFDRSLGFFAEFSLFINFIEKKGMGTCGVNYTKSGANLYYDPIFIESLSQKQLIFILVHEIMHLLSKHPQRVLDSKNDIGLSNIAQDMIINSSLKTEVNKDKYEILDGALFVPKEYCDKEIYEVLYDWLVKQKSQGSGKGKGGKGKSSKNQDGEQGSDKSQNPLGEKALQDILSGSEEYEFDKHMRDEITEEMKETFINEAIDILKSRGLVSGNMERILTKIQKVRRDYLNEIKKSINYISGLTKYKTYIRPNRKQIKALKGKRKQTKILNCILDTSGSMTNEINKVLSYIFQNNIIINLIQCDTKVQDFKVIKSIKELTNLKIKGFGGTILQPAFNFLAEHNDLKRYNSVILTDGYTGWIEIKNQTKILVISTSKEIDFINGRNVKQILIES